MSTQCSTYWIKLNHLFSHNFEFQMNRSVEEQAAAFWNKIFTKHSERDRYVILSASGLDYKFFVYVTFQG